MRSLVHSEGMADHIIIQSAGTANWHTGKLPDQRMRSAAQNRGHGLNSRARQLTTRDLHDQDLILVMDRANLGDARALDRESKFGGKIRLFCEFCTEHEEQEVPDPYYGGEQGFEHVLDLLEDGCRGVLQHIRELRGL